jgi:hypothetical protein
MVGRTPLALICDETPDISVWIEFELYALWFMSFGKKQEVNRMIG